MAAINVDFFQNIGMLKLDFCLHPSKVPINNFFYSVYGNSGFTLKGAFDISSLRSRETVPSLFFRTGINNNYFIKVKYLLNGEEKEHFKIIDLTRLHRKENINMNILDRSVEELFKSINLEEDDEEEESDNESNYNESNDNDSNDNESIDNDSSQMMSITFNKECSSKTNNEQDGNE
tara:strand:- start:383 stop:913 length:531 start_codon:yes stop_codon:yes gene_type:complete